MSKGPVSDRVLKWAPRDFGVYPGGGRVVACALHGQRTDIPCGDRGTQPCGGYSHYTTAGTQVDCRPALDSPHLLQHIDQEMRVVLWRVHTWRRNNVHTIGIHVVVTGPVPFSSGTCRDPSTALGSVMPTETGLKPPRPLAKAREADPNTFNVATETAQHL